jgi:hypothetical protein
MSIRVPGAGRGDRDLRLNRFDEGFRRRRPAAVVGDLEEVDVRQVVGEERRVDALFDVAHEQEAPRADLAQEDHRDIIDTCATVRRCRRDFATDRPENAERYLVDGEAVAGSDRETGRGLGRREPPGPRRVARPRPSHPRLEDAVHAIPLDEHRQACHVVFVRMGQDDGVDAAIPRRYPLVEGDEEAIRVRPSIDQEAAAPRALDEDRVSLPHVKDRYPGDAGWSSGHDRTGDRERHDEGEDASPTGSRAVLPSRLGGGGTAASRSSHGRRLYMWGSRPIPASRPPRHDADPSCRGHRRDDIEWRSERHACEREAGRRVDDRDEDPEDHPPGSGEDRTDDLRPAGEDKRATTERDDPGRHRRRNQRDHDEVDDR